jgi:hypothetical protein
MKRLIVKYNSIFEETERMEIEAKIRREWEERKAVFIPDGCDYEIIDDGVNEAAIWLDQEIEKRKAAVPKAAVKDSRKFEKCNHCNWDKYRDGYHPNGNPCDSCIDGRNFSPEMRNRA